MGTRLTKAAVAATLAGSLLLGGCYGKFGLTRKLYGWNGQATGNKFANSAIMFGLLVIPVYELSLLGDWLIFNTIEVFTGSNPISRVETTTRGGHEWALRAVDENHVAVSRDGVVVGLISRADVEAP